MLWAMLMLMQQLCLEHLRSPLHPSNSKSAELTEELEGQGSFLFHWWWFEKAYRCVCPTQCPGHCSKVPPECAGTVAQP